MVEMTNEQAATMLLFFIERASGEVLDPDLLRRIKTLCRS